MKYAQREDNGVDDPYKNFFANTSFQEFLVPPYLYLIDTDPRYSRILSPDIDFHDHYYVVGGILGTGVNGSVRSVRSKETGELFACKALSFNNMSMKTLQAHYNEIMVYLELDHPYVCSLVHLFTCPSSIIMIMEYGAEGALVHRIGTELPCLDEMKDIFVDMLRAVEYLHSKGYVHRDLKLDNWVVMAAEEKALRLIDFGFARKTIEGLPMTAIRGTAYYVAPEVLSGCYYSKIDIWSLGVIFYVFLYGKFPCTGTPEEAIKKLNVNHEIEWELNDRVSEEAAEFCKSLLERDPDKRLTAREALSHPFIGKRSVPVRGDDSEEMQNFRKAYKVYRTLPVVLQDILLVCCYLVSTDTNQSFVSGFLDLTSTEGVIDYADRKIEFSEYICVMLCNNEQLLTRELKKTIKVINSFHKINMPTTLTLKAITIKLGKTIHGNNTEDEYNAMCEELDVKPKNGVPLSTIVSYIMKCSKT